MIEGSSLILLKVPALRGSGLHGDCAAVAASIRPDRSRPPGDPGRPIAPDKKKAGLSPGPVGAGAV
jgi:hypothetical protein